jgi:isoleucyl-tRNA synthetase
MFGFEQNESFPEREERVLRFWQERGIFRKSVEERRDRPLFTIYDGPPFATGLPHYGHLLAGTIKDVVPRYKTMKGFCVPRGFGWDCHGLPVENEIEKARELSGAASIEAFGIARFNEECRAIVQRYVEEWKKTVDRMGRWVDFGQTFKTMDVSFMESVWWVFRQLHDMELVYEGFKVMPFSTRLGTPLSNFEANLNYKDVDDPSVVVAFEWLEEPGVYFLAWTTTPWTLPSNLALMVGPEVEYVRVRDSRGKEYVVAERLWQSLFKEGGEIVGRSLGRDLAGKKYRPLFDFFADREAFRVIVEEAVSVEEGTGIVHSAPAFGELDFFACKREGIELVCPVDNEGRFTEEVPPYRGLLVKDADRQIIQDLKRRGLVFWQGTVRHRYPFCWRTDTPLIYKAVSTWFVAVERIKRELIEANEQVNWVPNHIKGGRFGKWLEHARDWAVSRNRYWGTPIPIWRNEEGELHVVGSIQELEALTGAKIDDLHRHKIDHLTFRKGGKEYKRVSEVFDCWFESGSMPYAQHHYPFENGQLFEKTFPADFIAEGLDQTRGWFYTLMVLSTALKRAPAFKNVIVNGIILAEDGNKMSKRLRNYPDPEKVVRQYGADAVRLYMMDSPAVSAEDLRFSEKGVEQVLRQVLIPYWNSFVFLATYAKIYRWQPREEKPKALIDRWVLSMAQKLVRDVEEAMERYSLNEAVAPLVGFVDQLTNWYIRRCRSRFWADEDSADRRAAFWTLYSVLLTFSKVAAPFIPFLTDAIYRELRTEEMPESVHLCSFPSYEAALRDEDLEREVSAAQAAVSLGHALRKEYKLKVRQPLARAHLITSNRELLRALEKQKQLIADELNVKAIDLHADEGNFVIWTAKPNFPVLGKKIGRRMPQAQQAIGALDRKQIQVLAAGKSLDLDIGGEILSLEPADVQIERKVKEGLAAGNEKDLTVALDTALNEELLSEGLARELVNKINTMRREQNFNVTDRIRVVIQAGEKVRRAFAEHRAYVVGETLAQEVVFGNVEGVAWDLNGESVQLSIQKVDKKS